MLVPLKTNTAIAMDYALLKKAFPFLNSLLFKHNCSCTKPFEFDQKPDPAR